MPDAGGLTHFDELIYERLKVEAKNLLRRNRGAAGLTPTSLMHDAYVRMLKPGGDGWESEHHFRAAAALAMRHVLVDRARNHGAAKRGKDWVRVTLEGLAGGLVDVDVYALDEVLEQLSAIDPIGGKVVQLRFFGGMTNPEIATALDQSLRSVERSWRGARAWLATRLGPA